MIIRAWKKYVFFPEAGIKLWDFVTFLVLSFGSAGFITQYYTSKHLVDKFYKQNIFLYETKSLELDVIVSVSNVWGVRNVENLISFFYYLRVFN